MLSIVTIHAYMLDNRLRNEARYEYEYEYIQGVIHMYT